MAASTRKKPGTKNTTKKTAKKSSPTQGKKSSPTQGKKSSPVAKKSVSTAVKKPSSVKSSPTKKKLSSRKVIKKPENSQFQKVPLKEEIARSSSSDVDTTMFTTILAVFIVAFVVLAGYIYARRFQKPEMTNTYNEQSTSPQRISVAAGVALNPQVVEGIETLSQVIIFRDGDVLQNVASISDVSVSRKTNPIFFSNVLENDLVFEFKDMNVLYRPSSRQVINIEQKF